MKYCAILLPALLIATCALGETADTKTVGQKPVEVQNEDGHFVIMTPQQAQEAAGDGGGIGVRLALDKDEKLTITGIIPGSPAQKANLQSGDSIVQIDGRKTQSLGVAAAARMIRGKPGTTVVLKIRSRKTGRLATISMVRASDFLRGDAPKTSVRIEQVKLKTLGVESCPSTHGQCHFLTYDSGTCTYTCPKTP